MQVAACRDLWFLHDGRAESLRHFVAALRTVDGYPTGSLLFHMTLAVVRAEGGLR